MEPLEWITYIDSFLKNYNPSFPPLFFNLQDYNSFLDENLLILPIVIDIYNKLLSKYTNINKILKKLYIISIYILCLKFYSDIPLKNPLSLIYILFYDYYDLNTIKHVEIDILKTIDYSFPF